MIQPPQGQLSTGIELVDVDISQLAERYQTARFAHIPRFVQPDYAAQLLAATQGVPSKRVVCGSEAVVYGIVEAEWDEQNFDSDHPAHQFYLTDEVVDFVQSVSGLQAVSQLVCWTSCYRMGEYINPHCDSEGTVQLLVCLQAPPGPQNGGKLIVGGAELFLSPGDTVVFEATSLEHSTTPLIASEDEPDPRRVVLVGRYFA